MKKILSMSVGLLLLLGSFVGLYLALSQQDVRNQAASSPREIAVVDGKPISEADLIRETDDLYQTTTTDTAALKVSLNALIEQRLLEQEMQALGVSISEEEIAAQLLKDGLSNFSSNATITEAARLSVMRRKVEFAHTKTRTAFTVGFWLPPKDYEVPLSAEQRVLLAQQRRDAPSALRAIQRRLEQGEEPLAVAKAMVRQYPSLSPIMAVNGYILEKTADETVMTEPVVYSYQGGRAQLTFFKTLFELQPGQIKTARDEQSTDGGSVIKVVSATNGPFDTYTDWLRDARSKRVVIKNSL